MPGDLLGLFALLAFVLVVTVLVVAKSVTRVPVDERLVVARMGRFDQHSVRGPGRVFLIPITDRGIRVSMLPQRFVLDAVPAQAPDGSGVLVDLDIRFRVVDPYAFVANILPPPAGLTALARGALQRALRAAEPGGALFPGDVEDQVAPSIEGALVSGGARDVTVKVTRVRPGSIEGADDAEFQAFLRQQGIKSPRHTKRRV